MNFCGHRPFFSGEGGGRREVRSGLGISKQTTRTERKETQCASADAAAQRGVRELLGAALAQSAGARLRVFGQRRAPLFVRRRQDVRRDRRRDRVRVTARRCAHAHLLRFVTQPTSATVVCSVPSSVGAAVRVSVDGSGIARRCTRSARRARCRRWRRR